MSVPCIHVLIDDGPVIKLDEAYASFDQSPRQQALATVKARDEFSTVVNRAAFGKERVILTRRGKKLAALVPIEDVKVLEELEDRLGLQEAERILADRNEAPIPYKKARKRLGLK